MARLYTNENFLLPSVEALRKLGHDVLTTLDAGNADQAVPDEDVLAFATSEKRILITFNRKHFIRLHHRNPDHAGIIACTFDADFDALARRIDLLLADEQSVNGRLLRINRPQRL